MKYRLVYTRRADRDIQGLDPDIRERLGKALLRYEEDPLRHAEKLTQSVLGSYRFRIGDYRVVFDLTSPSTPSSTISKTRVSLSSKGFSHFVGRASADTMKK
ncbi:MAG: type II toxin-antitoxin system RelE/ParE family toxin [candidate division NC10 bacterium]|nr:type II toxin-antitoxin system RelE/ParE family toxin [candidate division NC10 bacterium]